MTQKSMYCISIIASHFNYCFPYFYHSSVIPIRTTSSIRCGAGTVSNCTDWRMAESFHSQVNHIGGSGAARSKMVLGSNTFNPTEVGSVMAHPDNRQCLFFLSFGLALLLVSQPVAVYHLTHSPHSLTSLTHLSSCVLAARSKLVNTVLPFQLKRMAKSQRIRGLAL